MSPQETWLTEEVKTLKGGIPAGNQQSNICIALAFAPNITTNMPEDMALCDQDGMFSMDFVNVFYASSENENIWSAS